MHNPKIKFWSRWLVCASAVFAVLSLTWIFFGSFDPFGIYDSRLAGALFGRETLSASEQSVFGFGAGLLGATGFAFFVLCAFLAGIPFLNGEKWAHTALTAGIVSWFVLDSVFSVYMNAYFNVFIVNVPCLLAYAVPLAMTAPYFYRNR